MISAPNGASMVVVKLTALPQRSTMLIWLVPRSIVAGRQAGPDRAQAAVGRDQQAAFGDIGRRE